MGIVETFSPVTRVAKRAICHRILLIIASATTIISENEAADKGPEIWMSQYILGLDQNDSPIGGTLFRSLEQFKTRHISKNGSDFVVSTEQVSTVDFTCEAGFPITWKFPFPEQVRSEADMLSPKYNRISNWSTKAKTPENVKFVTVLLVNLYRKRGHFLSFNLTCESVESNLKLASSIHLYLNAQGKQNLENQGKTLNISIPDPNNPSRLPAFLLPCRTATPDVNLLLEKQTTNKSSQNQVWKPINCSKNHITFDPKRGFVFENGLHGNKIFGFYRCSVINKDATTGPTKTNAGGKNTKKGNGQFVFFNVTKKVEINGTSPTRTGSSFELRVNLRGNASARVMLADKGNVDDDFPSFMCCSGVKDKRPKVQYDSCSNPVQCQFIRDAIVKDCAENKPRYNWERSLVRESSDCSLLFPTDPDQADHLSTIVVCQGVNIDVMEEFYFLFDPVTSNIVEGESKGSIKPNQLGKPKLLRQDPVFKFVRSATVKIATSSEKIMLTVVRRHEVPKQGYNHYMHLSEDFIMGKEQSFRDRIRDTTYLQYDRDIFEGENITFVCFGTKLFYASGGYLRINWKNGTKTTLGHSAAGFVYFRDSPVYTKNPGFMTITSRIGSAVLANQEMMSVECWMPQLLSRGWDTITRNIQIIPSVAPTFVEKKEESVNFYYREENNLLTCTVNQGLPPPDVVVTHNGIRLGVTDRAEEHHYSYPSGQDKPRDVGIKLATSHVNNVTIVDILFPPIRSSHQCIFQFVVSNSNSSVTRTIKVNVLQKDERCSCSLNERLASPRHLPASTSVGDGKKQTTPSSKVDKEKQMKVVNVRVKLPANQIAYQNGVQCTASNFNGTTGTFELALMEKSSTANKVGNAALA